MIAHHLSVALREAEQAVRGARAGATEGPWFEMTFGPEVTGGEPQVILSCDWPAVIEVACMGRAMTATFEEQQANARYIAALVQADLARAAIEAEDA